MDLSAQTWHKEIFESLRVEQIRQIAYVPDAGFNALLRLCMDEPTMDTTVLSTEEEGIALLAGAWLGGDRGVLMLQSSGVGNCFNMLTLAENCAFPLVMVVTMRGEWQEFNPWQEPMGRNTPAGLEMAGVRVRRIEQAEQAGEAVSESVRYAYGNNRAAAVLISQQLIGAKQWR